MISIDCLRADCIGAFPNKILLKKYGIDLSILKTPTLNELAKQGCFFTNCFTASTYTTASHASILTGFYPINNGVQEYFKNKIDKKTIFEIIKKNNKDYFTLFCTDFPFILGRHLGFDRKIDYYSDGDEKKSIKMLKKNKSRRFLAFFHFGNVHAPYGISGIKEDGNKFINKVNKLIKEYGIDLEHNADIEWFEKDRSAKEISLRKAYHQAIEKAYSAEEYSKLMSMYIDGVSYFDKNRFRNFIRLLKKSGVFKDSILFIFSDHGERWWNDSHGHHDNLYDDTIRVPLIIIGEGFPKNKIIDAQIRTIDIAPTIAHLLKIKNINSFDGKSLLPLEKIKPSFAMGEIWTCKDINNIKSLMQKVQKRGKMIQSDRHAYNGFLWKEYIRAEKYKLINEYEGSRKNIMMLGIVNGLEKRIVAKKSILDKMEKELLKYKKLGKIRKNIISKPDEIKQIRKNLVSLGYNV